MAKRRRGRGIQLKSNQSLNSPSGSNEIEVNEMKPNTSKIRIKKEPFNGSDMSLLKEVDSTNPFEEEELYLTSTSFDGFTGPCQKSKLKSLTNVLHKNQKSSSRNCGIKLNSVVNPPISQENNENVMSCKDSPLCLSSDNSQTKIKREPPNQLEDCEINIAGSVESKIKLEVVDRSGKNDPLLTTTPIESSSATSSSLKSANEDNTDYKSLFEALCKHIKIPTNISKNELIKTLNLTDAKFPNSHDKVVEIDVPIKQTASIVDIPLIKNVSVDMADINTREHESNGSNKNVTHIKTESDISPVKKSEVKTKAALVSGIFFDNSILYQVKTHSQSVDKKDTFISQVEEKDKIIEKPITNNLSALTQMEDALISFPICRKEYDNSKVELSSLPNQSEIMKHDSSLQIKKEKTIDATAEPAILQDTLIPTEKSEIVEIKKEMHSVSEKKGTVMQNKLDNHSPPDKCVLDVKTLSIPLINSRIEEKTTSTDNKQGQLNINAYDSNHKLIDNNSSGLDNCLVNNSPVEELDVSNNSMEDKLKLVNESSHVTCVANKSICRGVRKLKTLKKEIITPAILEGKESVKLSIVELAKSSSSPMKITREESLKCTVEDVKAKGEINTISISMNDREAQSSVNYECSATVTDVNNLDNSKLQNDIPLLDNNLLSIRCEPNNVIEKHIYKNSTTSSLLDDKSKETENLVKDGAEDLKNSPEDEDLNYSDFFVIDEVNDKFYLEVCDLEKEIITNKHCGAISSDKNKKVLLKNTNATKLSKPESSDKRSSLDKNPSSEAIPGLSFIIGMKVDDKSSKALYDCVLCTWDKNSNIMSGIEMKNHVKTRSHLMNLLMMQNYPLYERHMKENKEWITTSSLLEIVLKDEASKAAQTIVVASKENYSIKKNQIISRINDLIRNFGKGTSTSELKTNKEVVAKTFVDPQTSFVSTNPSQKHFKPSIVDPLLQKTQPVLPLANSPCLPNSDSSPSSPLTKPFGTTAPVQSVVTAPLCLQSTFNVSTISSGYPVITTAQSYMESKLGLNFKQSAVTSEIKPMSVIGKGTRIYEDLYSQISSNAIVSAPFKPASSMSVTSSVSSLPISEEKKNINFSPKMAVSMSPIPAEILMPPPLSVSVLTKTKKVNNGKEKVTTAPTMPSFTPISLLVSNISLPASSLLPSVVPNVPILIENVVTPIEICDYEQVAIVSDSRYEPYIKHLREVPNVSIINRPALRMEDVYDSITNNFQFVDAQKQTLYLFVSGIHSITNLAPAYSCCVSNCKCPLEALNSLDDVKYCGEPAKYAELFSEKLIYMMNSVASILPKNSNIGILPPLPISLISTGVTHKKLHEKKLLFPDYMIANRKASIASLYSFWMNNISHLAHKSLSNYEKISSSLLKNIDDNRKMREMDCSPQDNPSFTVWKHVVRNVVNMALQKDTKISQGVLKGDRPTENWQTVIEKLSKPAKSNSFTVEPQHSSNNWTKIAYDHLVFIGHTPSLELLPEIDFCKNTKWEFEEIVESQNLFLKMGSLNKMAIKKVLFIIVSDIAMIGTKERSPECLVKKCEMTLTNIHTQLKKQPPNKMRNTIFMPIDIIITEIKKFCIFDSRVVVAPFTPRTYVFVPNMNAEIKYHSKMHDFVRFQSSVCFLKGSTKLNWENTLKSFEAEWDKLALEIPQETMEHIKYVKHILADIKTKNYKPVNWKNLTIDSPVDVDSSLVIWKLCVEELAWKAWVEQVQLSPFEDKKIACLETLPLFPSASELQSILPQVSKEIIPSYKKNIINVSKNIIANKKIIMSDLRNISLSGTSKANEIDKVQPELNRDHNKVIKFAKDILNAKRVKKGQAGISSIFNNVYIIRHVSQQVSQKELINPFSECNFRSKMIFHNFSKYDDSDLKSLLAKLGDYPAKSLCCLVFDLSIITTKLVISSGCSTHSCDPLLLINGLGIKKSISSQALQELDNLIENRLKSITEFIQKLNKRISVLIVPLVPTKIYCDDENIVDHQISHAISNMGAFVVNGSHVLWTRAIQTLIPSWNNIMEKFNWEYDYFNYIPTYAANKLNTFLLLNNASDINSKWVEPDVWKAFGEIFLLSLVPKKSGIIDSGIKFMSDKTLVSINITGISSAIPYGFFEELFKNIDSKVIIEKVKEIYVVKNIMLVRAVLLAKILNEYRVGVRTLSAAVHGISGPVNTEINNMQRLYVTSVFEKVYASWEPQIIKNLIKDIEGFDVATLKTTICEKGLICEGTKQCVHYHSLLDKRRNPLQISYKPLLCHHPRQLDGSCKDQCSLSRNIFEQNFHPLNFQVKLCPSRASSEICNKRELCKYAHKDSPELLFTSDWQDQTVVGADNVLKYFAGAIRGSKKLPQPNNFKIILVSPSAELLDLVIRVCDELIKVFGLKVFKLGKILDKPDNCDIIVGEPQAFAEMDAEVLRSMTGVIIVDDIQTILDHQEKADALHTLIRRVKQTSVDYLTLVGLVMICTTEKGYKSAGGTKYFSNALDTKLLEQNSYTNTTSISTYHPVKEHVPQLLTTKLSSSKRKDFSRSRSRSHEKKLCSAADSSNITKTSSIISTDNSDSALSDSERLHRRLRPKCADKSHSRRSRSRSKDRRSRDHKNSSRSRDLKKRSQSRDLKKRSQSKDLKKGSRSRDLKNRSRSRDLKKRSRSRDLKRISPPRDLKKRLHSGDFKNSLQSRSFSGIKEISKSFPHKEGLISNDKNNLAAFDSSKERTGPQSTSQLSSLTNYSKLFSESASGSLDYIAQPHKPGNCYQDQVSSNLKYVPLEDKESTYPNLVNDDATEETSIIDRLDTKHYEEYGKMLEIQKQLFEKEFLVFKNVPELCPSYGRYYDAFSSAYAEQHGYKGEEHKEKMWALYWTSKLDEIKKEDWRVRQVKLLGEFEKKASPLSTKATKKEYEVKPNQFFGSTIPLSTSTVTLETNLQCQSNQSYQVNKVDYNDGEEDNSFDFENALAILEKLCDYIGFLGPALNAMVLKCKELDFSEDAYNVFTLSENVMVVNMVLDKVKTLKLSANSNLLNLFESAIEIIPKLLMEAKNGPKPSVHEPVEGAPIDVIAIARVSMGKSSDFTLNLLKTALQYEGISNPSREFINDLYLKVCKMQFELSSND